MPCLNCMCFASIPWFAQMDGIVSCSLSWAAEEFAPHVAFASLISFQTPSRQGRLCAPEGRAESFGDPVLLLRFMLQRDGFLAADGFQAWAGGWREGSVASQLLCIPLSDPPVRRAVQAGRCAQRHLNGCVWDPSGCLWWAKPWDCLPALSVTQHLLLVLFPD